MTIFTKDHIHRIVLCVFLSLFFLQCLPRVTCQQDWDFTDDSTNKEKHFSTGTTVAIILLGMFVTILISCGSLYALFAYNFRRLIAEVGREDLHSGATTGVAKEVIESFPSFIYSDVKEIGGVECAVCLQEFEDEEKLRWMPPCSHTFHANCIDVWLSSRTTCPVYRANLSLKPDESFPYLSIDLERGNVRRGVGESSNEISLTDGSKSWTNHANYRTTRSRSTGSLSSLHMAPDSSVERGKNLNRFTLQLPEEVQRHLVLPRAMSSRQDYRRECDGSEISGFSQGKQTLRHVMSKSLSFTFQEASVRSTTGRDDLVLETSQVKDKDICEQSFQRLMPEKV
ncbi:hypothetical protein CARUB_v10002742mg [Capsella rubella]|uniref:RING-type E3 ubiquitin transferase n=1 Tax=Capsella rubella TaxID=81985 RepID=R0FJA5_9BRAS|nr:putative RING-H2 finger protein ATL37 [Capsella rubella]EOA22171.1 hypothetical protein CARUB_v10002742mg [Capsella rubella]